LGKVNYQSTTRKTGPATAPKVEKNTERCAWRKPALKDRGRDLNAGFEGRGNRGKELEIGQGGRGGKPQEPHQLHGRGIKER